MSAKDGKEQKRYNMKRKSFYIVIVLLCFVLTFHQSAFASSQNATLLLDHVNSMNLGFKQFQLDHPEITLVQNEKFYKTTEELASDLFLREMKCDIIGLGGGSIDERIIADKGYVVDLSNSEVIKKEISRMHPFIQQQLIRDGRIIGVPEMLTFRFTSILMDVWEEAGYTEEDIPHTFSEFLDFLDAFAERLADDPSAGFCIINSWDEGLYTETNYTEWLLKQLFDEYVREKLFAEQSVRFTDKELLDLMKRCKEVGHKLYLYEPMNQGKSFFVETQSYRWPQNATLLSIPIYEDQPTLITCELRIYAVSSLSQQQEIAIELLEYIVSDLQKSTAVYFYPDAEPLIDPNYEKGVANYSKKIADVQKKLENKNLDVATRDDLEASLRKYQDSLADRESRKYLVSEEQLQQYYSYIPYMYVYHASKFSDAVGVDWEVMQILNRFAAGQTSAENALKELDQKAWMMEMEDQ